MQRTGNSDELRDLIEHGSGINTGGNGAPGSQPRPGTHTPRPTHKVAPSARGPAQDDFRMRISDCGLKKLCLFNPHSAHHEIHN